MPQKQWLKKYSKLDYLDGILRNRRQHLGDPSDWHNENDSEGNGADHSLMFSWRKLPPLPNAS